MTNPPSTSSPTSLANMKEVSVTASPGNLGVFVNEVSGEDYLVVSGLHESSPLRGSVKPGDRLKAMNGIDLKGWSLDKLAALCKDQKEYAKNLDILQTPIKAIRTRTKTFSCNYNPLNPSRNKRVSPRKAVSPTSNAKHKRRPHPPMIAFEKLRPLPPEGYQRQIIEAPPGTLGIKVYVNDGFLKVHWVSEDCKLNIQVEDIIERIDSFNLQYWTRDKFVNYCKENASNKRYLHVLTKVETSATAVTNRVPSFVADPHPADKKIVPSCRTPASAQKIAEALTQLPGKQTTKHEQGSNGARTDSPVQAAHRDKYGLYPRPAGRGPCGMEWDAVDGLWIPEGPAQPVVIHPYTAPCCILSDSSEI